MLAHRFMAHPVHEYIAGGSGRDCTVQANLDAYAHWSVVPRLLRDVTGGHTQLAMAGTSFAHPIFLAPVAFQRLAHVHGEMETARAAQATESCLVASTLASVSMEETARVAGPQRWFQLYMQPQRNVTRDLLRRAEAAGYGAIVVTLDASVQAASLRALRAEFLRPTDCIAVNLAGYNMSADAGAPTAGSRIFQGIMRQAPVWADLEWLMTQTTLPIWVKGVLHRDDAVMLKDKGVAGLVVSNHGGRSLDGAPASLHVLPAIRAAVGADFPLLLDGGIRSGSDVFKALALGANAVMIGRLQMYALSIAGALGVAHMIQLLREELELCMAMAGCTTLKEIDRHALVAANMPYA